MRDGERDKESELNETKKKLKRTNKNEYDKGILYNPWANKKHCTRTHTETESERGREIAKYSCIDYDQNLNTNIHENRERNRKRIILECT